MIETVFLDQRGQFSTEAAGLRGFVNNHATPCFFDGTHDSVDIQRPQAAKINDFRIHPRFGGGRFTYEHHRAVSQHCYIITGPEYRRRFQFDAVIALRNLAQRMIRPGHDWPVVMSVERAVVKPFWLEKNDRITAFNGRDEQTFCVIRVGRDHRAQTTDMGENGFGALTVRLAAINAATAWHAYGERGGEVTRRPVAQTRGFGNDLICCRIKIIGELDFHHGPQAIGTHADGRTHNTPFRYGRIKDTRFPVLGLQPLGTAENPAKVSDILSEHDHVFITLEHDVHGRPYGLDHGHGYALRASRLIGAGQIAVFDPICRYLADA